MVKIMNIETGNELNVIEENTKRDMNRLEGNTVTEKKDEPTAA